MEFNHQNLYTRSSLFEVSHHCLTLIEKQLAKSHLLAFDATNCVVYGYHEVLALYQAGIMLGRQCGVWN